MKQILTIMMLLFIGFHNPVEENFAIEISGTVVGTDDGLPLPGVNVIIKGTQKGVSTDMNGKYQITVKNQKAVLVFQYLGYVTQKIKVKSKTVINVKMAPDQVVLSEVVVTAQGISRSKKSLGYSISQPANTEYDEIIHLNFGNTESYAEINENGFKSPWKNPLSTFSIDVDAASYSNVRRFLDRDVMPPKDAVKIEELINYFDYNYEAPRGDEPFSINTEVSTAPWNKDHYLVHIGLQGEKIDLDELPPSNIVFLLDVSGSMNNPNKLPLLKKSLKLLVNELRPEDRVAIVVYAGAAGEVLASTSGADKEKILKSLNKLSAGGSTAGGAGIELAYQIAQENFIEGGNNRIVLATDGDFNVGASSDKAMEDLIEEKRKSGVFLTVLGFGMGNYQDAKLEILADKGNGNHAYIDNLLEAKKVLVTEFGGTMYTIAKDVKIQVEFNPAQVDGYRLIGYENRLLAAEDFNDDTKDAGELGSGHTLTALYEVIPKGANSGFKPVDELKYQQSETKIAMNTTDLMTVKLRYKNPEEDKSLYLDRVITANELSSSQSEDFMWSASVAAFGMKLRGSDYAKLDYAEIIQMAKSAKGADINGYRAELIQLIEKAELIDESGD